MVVFQTFTARDSSKEPQVFNDNRFLGNTKQYFDFGCKWAQTQTELLVKSDLDPQFLLCNRRFSIYYLLSQLCDHNSSNINQKRKTASHQICKCNNKSNKNIRQRYGDEVENRLRMSLKEKLLQGLCIPVKALHYMRRSLQFKTELLLSRLYETST